MQLVPWIQLDNIYFSVDNPENDATTGRRGSKGREEATYEGRKGGDAVGKQTDP